MCNVTTMLKVLVDAMNGFANISHNTTSDIIIYYATPYLLILSLSGVVWGVLGVGQIKGLAEEGAKAQGNKRK